MHTCPDCGQACYCDGDDTCIETEEAWMECEHDCGPEECDDDDDYADATGVKLERLRYGDAPLTNPMGDA